MATHARETKPPSLERPTPAAESTASLWEFASFAVSSGARVKLIALRQAVTL